MGNGRAVDPGCQAAGAAAQWICGVVFELARDMPSSHGAAPLHPIGIADILRHTRLGDGNRLVDCFTAINQAFQAIRKIRKRPYLALINKDI
jgi:hypothetical protein